MTKEESRNDWYRSLNDDWRDIGPDQIWDAAYRAGQLAMRERAAAVAYLSRYPSFRIGAEISKLEPE